MTKDMRYIKHIRVNLLRKCVSTAAAVMLCIAGAVAQHRPAGEDALSVRVTDPQGRPLAGVVVTVNEGQQQFVTGRDGQLRFDASGPDQVSFIKYGYGRSSVAANELAAGGDFVLEPLDLFTDEDDILHLPFIDESRRYSTGSSYKVQGRELERYPTTDIRQALTGIVPGLDVVQKHGGPGTTALEHVDGYDALAKISLSMRGNSPIFMVDNVPVLINETPLDPEQIESITVIKDVVEKTLYGPYAGNGIVHIRTKRGTANQRVFNVTYEEGVNVVDRFPEFVDGADYARLNNIARNNSGLDMLYTLSDIEKYAEGNPYDMFYPNADYRKLMLRNTMGYRRAHVSSSGGTDNVTYSVNLGYAGEGDLFKIGPKADYHRINFSSHLDIRLNSFIRARFGFVSNIIFRNSPNYKYNGNWSAMSPSETNGIYAHDFTQAVYDINRTPGNAFPVYANNSDELTKPWYGVSQNFTQNPVGNLVHNGEYIDRTRKGLINVAVDMDFSFLLPGLKSTSFVAYDATNLVRIGTTENYEAYIVGKGTDENGNTVPVLTSSSSHSLTEITQTRLLDYYGNRLFGSQSFMYDNRFNGRHDVSAAMTWFVTKRMQRYVTEHRREATGTLFLNYVLDRKYIVQASAAASGTYALRNNTWSFSPSVGAGWIISEEDFMARAPKLDFLKIKAQYGVLHYDNSMSVNRDIDNYTYNSDGQRFGPYANSSTQWFGSTQSSNPQRTSPNLIGNADLVFEKRKELSAGFEGLAFDRRLWFEATYYNSLHDGIVAQSRYIVPYLAGINEALPWANYNRYRYQGLEMAAAFTSRKGEFSYSIGLNATVQHSKVLKVDEIDPRYGYQSKSGKPVGAIFGLKHTGQFATDAETLLIPQMYDEQLHAGDLRYLDMNGDGIIDDDDKAMIGNSVPKLFFGITLNFEYKGFDLAVVGSGRAFYDLQLTNRYFWNGWGDDNYSKFTKYNNGQNGYPRLTYYKVNNNYQMSDFWLKDGSYFKLKLVELGYNLPVRKWNIRTFRGIRVYVTGSNLFTISGIKDVDPEAIDSGISHYPLMRTFAGGVKLTF